MMFKLILVRFDRDAGRFEDDEFNKFCAEQNIVRIEKEFINTGGEIYYSFFIEYHTRHIYSPHKALSQFIQVRLVCNFG